MPPPRHLAAAALALAATGAAAVQRLHAAAALPPDYDELVYLPVAYRYAERLSPGRAGELAAWPENAEHPPLVKLGFAVSIAAAGAPEPEWRTLRVGQPLPPGARAAFAAARRPTAAASTAQVALLALTSPAAALLLALDPYHAKYGSQAMLEAIPGLLALAAALLLERALRAEGRRRLLLALSSAAALGAAAAGKYPYGAVTGLALAPLVVAGFPRRPGVWAAWAALAALALLALAPNLWADPAGGLAAAVRFHWAYAHGAHVAESGLAWWAPLHALTHLLPARWHPGVFAGEGAATFLLLPLAAIGFPRAWRTRRVFAAWAVAGLAFLLLWPTKWAQYLLLVLPALAACAGEAPATLAAAWRRLRGLEPARRD